MKKAAKASTGMVWGLISALLLLLGFAFLSKELIGNELKQFDDWVGNAVRSTQNPSMTRVMIMLTQAGSAIVEFPLTVFLGTLFIWLYRKVWFALAIFVNLAGAWLINFGLKEIFKRARPDIQHLVEAGGYSFPSGHAMVSAAFYGLLGYLLWRMAAGFYRFLIVFADAALTLLIGWSRIYLGVHYASDIAAGYLAGGVWLIAVIYSMHKYKIIYSSSS